MTDANAVTVSDGEVSVMPINVAIICDEWEAGPTACALLQRAVNRAGEVRLGRVWLGQLDDLTPHATGDAVLDRTVGVHLIILALNTQAKPPAHLLNWLETWAARRQVRDAALAVFDCDDTLSETAVPELSHLAQRHGLSLILRDDDRGEEVTVVLQSAPLVMDVTLLPRLRPTTDFTGGNRYRCFGINE